MLKKNYKRQVFFKVSDYDIQLFYNLYTYIMDLTGAFGLI